MSFTIKQLRDDLRLTINQSGSSTNLVWENSELDVYIKDGVYYLIDKGRLELLQDALTVKAALNQYGTGLFTKPGEFYRFIAAEIDGVWVHKIHELADQKFIEDNDNLKGNSDRKYIYNYSGTLFEVRPSTTSTVTLHYVKDASVDMDTDSDSVPLTPQGARYALLYAQARVMESKLFKPEEAERIYNRVAQLIS